MIRSGNIDVADIVFFKFIKLSMKKRGLLEILLNFLIDRRRDNPDILFDILLCLAITANLKIKTSLMGIPLQPMVPSCWLDLDGMHGITNVISMRIFFMKVLYASRFQNIPVGSRLLFITAISKIIWCSNWISCQIRAREGQGKRGKKYSYAISILENNWKDVKSFFRFSKDIRRIMYTTTIIEGLNLQYRKVTKTKNVFSSNSALEKMIYFASGNVVKKWTQRYRNWDRVLNQFTVHYKKRLTQYL